MAARSVSRVLLGSWMLEGLGWFALAEGYARAVLEGAAVLVLWVAGTPWWVVAVGWVGIHTAAWFLLYGGYAKIRSLRHGATPIGRLLAFREQTESLIRRSKRIRAAVLYGSGARGALNEQSDVDLMIVPSPPRLAAILAVWSFRLGSVLRRMPLEANTIDLDRYLPFRLKGVPTVMVKSPPPRVGVDERLRTQGLIVTISGIDGSGKTTVARAVVESLSRRGYDAVYFYGHRPFYREGEFPISPALLFKALWRRLGRTSEDYTRHRRAKVLLDCLTLVDCVRIQSTLSRLLRPGRILVVDRYTGDVIVYLRSFGTPHQSIEGLLVGISFRPDLALLFDIEPSQARLRKAEETVEQLAWAAREYDDLADALDMTRIDASGSIETLRDVVIAKVETLLGNAPSDRNA